LECDGSTPLSFFGVAAPQEKERKRCRATALQIGGEIMGDLRIRLIERLCRLPQAQLARVEEFLGDLDEASEDSSGRCGFADRRSDPKAMAVVPHKDWPHAPVHRLSEHGTFMVTGATLNKEHFFRGEELLTFLQDELLSLAKQYRVVLEAWAVFSNHYHFVAHTSGIENQLATLISHLHTKTATEANRRDGTPGRVIWCNYWDTQLTFEKSYLARLHYVHQNAVKHGLVQVANEYRWCSASWFEGNATKSQIKTLYSFKIDRVNIDDAYGPV
jgi:putative transposase